MGLDQWDGGHALSVLVSLKHVAYAPSVEMTIMQEDASPEMGLGQVSRPWLTPNLHLAPGSRGGGYLGCV